jgi:hypothetical protein
MLTRFAIINFIVLISCVMFSFARAESILTDEEIILQSLHVHFPGAKPCLVTGKVNMPITLKKRYTIVCKCTYAVDKLTNMMSTLEDPNSIIKYHTEYIPVKEGNTFRAWLPQNTKVVFVREYDIYAPECYYCIAPTEYMIGNESSINIALNTFIPEGADQLTNYNGLLTDENKQPITNTHVTLRQYINKKKASFTNIEVNAKGEFSFQTPKMKDAEYVLEYNPIARTLQKQLWLVAHPERKMALTTPVTKEDVNVVFNIKSLKPGLIIEFRDESDKPMEIRDVKDLYEENKYLINCVITNEEKPEGWPGKTITENGVEKVIAFEPYRGGDGDVVNNAWIKTTTTKNDKQIKQKIENIDPVSRFSTIYKSEDNKTIAMFFDVNQLAGNNSIEIIDQEGRPYRYKPLLKSKTFKLDKSRTGETRIIVYVKPQQ